MRRSAFDPTGTHPRPAQDRFRLLRPTAGQAATGRCIAVMLQETTPAQAGPQHVPPQNRTRRQGEPERREGAGALVAGGKGGTGSRTRQGRTRDLFPHDLGCLSHIPHFFRLTIYRLTYTL